MLPSAWLSARRRTCATEAAKHHVRLSNRGSRWLTMAVSAYVALNTGLRLSCTFSCRTLATPYHVDAVVNLILQTRKLSLRDEGAGPRRTGPRRTSPRSAVAGVLLGLCCYTAAECTDQGTAGSEDLEGIRRAQNESQMTSADGRAAGPGSCLGLRPHLGDSPRLLTPATLISSIFFHTQLPASAASAA